MDKLQAAAEYANENKSGYEYGESDQEAIYEAFLAGHAHANRWVSVEEQLPKDGELVLCSGTGGITLDKHFNDGDGWFYNHKIHTITHWMPLPEKPNK